jgi:hypothetical protein
MVKKKKEIKEREIDPGSFYIKPNGIYNLPKKLSVGTRRSVEDIQKREEIRRNIEQENKPVETVPVQFDSKNYKETANKKLEDIGANVRVYNKPFHDTLLIILIGVIVIFGLFFVWSVANDKFKTDYSCPDCNCPQAQLSCPSVDLSKITQPACICNQTCPVYNDSAIIDAINNLSITNSSGS